MNAEPHRSSSEFGSLRGLWREVSSRRRAMGEISWVITGQVASAIAGLVGVKLLTSRLDPATYGVLALALTAAILVQQTVVAPLSGAYLRFYGPADESSALGDYLGAVRSTLWIAGAVITLLAALAAGFFLVREQPALAILSVATWAFAITAGLASVLDGILNAARRRAVVAVHQGSGQWLRYLFAVGLIVLLGPNASAAMTGFAIALVLVIASQQRYLRATIPQSLPSNRSGVWREKMLLYAWPFALFGIFTWIQLSADRWSLEVFASTESVGKYAVLYQLGFQPINMVGAALAQFAAPIIFARAGDGTNRDRLRDADRLVGVFALALVVIAAGTALFAWLAHSWLFAIFTTPEFSDVSFLLPVVILTGGIFGVGQAIVLSLLNENASRSLIAPKIVTALLAAAGFVVGAKVAGVVGVVFAGLLFSVTYMIWIVMLVAVRRRRSEARGGNA